MDRLISEQAVIDAIDKWIKDMGVLTVLPANKVTPLFESIHELSPVKQEPCDKCVYSTEDGYCQYDDITETIPPFKPCDDVIYRQAVLATISELNAISFYEAQEDSKECYYEIKNAIKQVPPANPQELKTDTLDKIRAEIEQTTSRYTISRERDARGQVEWSDRLIKESEILEILDKYKTESEE